MDIASESVFIIHNTNNYQDTDDKQALFGMQPIHVLHFFFK